jgi:hypothetical protein
MNVQPNSEDYERALARLRETPPVVSRHVLGLFGQTTNGSAVFIPDSYQRGYRDSLIPPGQRPHYVTNLGVIGQLSNGKWVFPPSYDHGLNQGSNDLKFAILAEGQRRLMQQIRELEGTQARLTNELEQTRNRLTQTKEELDRLNKQQ